MKKQKVILSMHLDYVSPCCVCVYLFYFSLLRLAFHVGHSTVNGSRALCTKPTTSLTSKYSTSMCLSVDPVYCSLNAQISFFSNFFIKNGPYDTIHIFKNYFTTIFSVFSKISGI